MKKLIFLFALLCSTWNMFAQQNGTFNNVYVNKVSPIYPATTGMNFKNAVNPVKIAVNDTLLINYIKYHAGSGFPYSLTLSQNISWEYPNEYNVNIFSPLTQFTLEKSFQINTYSVFTDPQTSIYSDSTQVNISATGINNSQSIVLDTTGLSYTERKTINNDNWIPDKFYVDSALFGKDILISLDTVTIYYSDGLPDSILNINLLPYQNYSCIEIDFYAIDSLSNNGNTYDFYINRNIEPLENEGDITISSSIVTTKLNTQISFKILKSGGNWLFMIPSTAPNSYVYKQHNYFYASLNFLRFAVSMTGTNNYHKNLFYTIKLYR